MASLPTGMKKDTISDAGSPPYGDSANTLLQDNSFKVDFASVGKYDFGHTEGLPPRSTPPPTPPGGNVPLSTQPKTGFPAIPIA